MTGHSNALPASKSATLGAAAALVAIVSLAAPGAAQAGSADGDTVNGQYCNDLCKAYMAWSNRVLSITQQSYSRPQVRVAVPQTVPPKRMDRADQLDKPERMAQNPSKPHRPGNLDSFAQLPSGSHSAQSAMDPARSDLASDDPAGRLFAAEPLRPSALADMRRATAEVGDMRLVSMSDRGPLTVGDASASSRSKMPSIWIMLSAAALLAFFGHGWLKRRNGASQAIN